MVDEPVKKNRHATAPMGTSIQAHIGQQLRAMYDETAAEPVPSNLLQLLDLLGADKSAPGSAGGAGRKASESA